MHGMTLDQASRWLFVVALAVVIALLLLPQEVLRIDLTRHDKIAHMGGFFVLGIIGALGWPSRRGLYLLVMPLLGLGLEAAQSWTPARHFEWADALANAAGLGIAVALSVIFTRTLDRMRQTRTPASKAR